MRFVQPCGSTWAQSPPSSRRGAGSSCGRPCRRGTDTAELVRPAAEAGVEFNPGAGWCVDPRCGARRMRLCFGHLDVDSIDRGIAALAGVVRHNRDLGD